MTGCGSERQSAGRLVLGVDGVDGVDREDKEDRVGEGGAVGPLNLRWIFGYRFVVYFVLLQLVTWQISVDTIINAVL